jgi:hypothetical protein
MFESNTSPSPGTGVVREKFVTELDVDCERRDRDKTLSRHQHRLRRIFFINRDPLNGAAARRFRYGSEAAAFAVRNSGLGAEWETEKTMADAPTYPSYMDLDPFIDVEWLKSLDGFVTARLMERLEAARDLAFYTGPFLLNEEAPRLPGSRLVSLTEGGNEDYYSLDRAEAWRPTAEAEAFAPLMEFIRTLPFAETGRIIIMYDFNGRAVPAHRDHESAELCHEFIWFRTNFAKPLFMLAPETGDRLYVSSHSAWFDTVNQYHGADAAPGLSFSIRVDGRFSDELRRHIPDAAANPASAPALWAAATAARLS